MAIVTRKTVKKYLRITSSEYDAIIDTYIPVVERDFEAIRGLDFDEDSNDVIEYPENAEMIAAQMIAYLIQTTSLNSGSYSDKSSESIGSYSYSRKMGADMIMGYPASIVGRIERYHNPKT